MQTNAAVIISNGGKKAVCSGLVPYHCGVMWCSFYVFIAKCIIRPEPSSSWNFFKIFCDLSGISEPTINVPKFWIKPNSNSIQVGVWEGSSEQFGTGLECFSHVVWQYLYVGGWHWCLNFASAEHKHFWYSQGQGEREHKHRCTKLLFPEGTSHHTVCSGHKLHWC